MFKVMPKLTPSKPNSLNMHQSKKYRKSIYGKGVKSAFPASAGPIGINLNLIEKYIDNSLNNTSTKNIKLCIRVPNRNQITSQMLIKTK